jgi:hypothetical protein
MTDRTIEILAKKYDFSSDEAKIYVKNILNVENQQANIYSEERNNVDSKKRKKMIMPFCGVICKENCKNLKMNHGLFTQCTNKFVNSKDELCQTCSNIINKNNGKYPLGRIEERMSGNPLKFKANNGKLVSTFGDVIKKLQISKEDVTKYAIKQGVKIPEFQFIETKKKRGRPRKETSIYDTDNEEIIEFETNIDEAKNENVKTSLVKRGRGRPKKDKKVIITKTIQDDYISDLYKKAETKFPDETNKNNNKFENMDCGHENVCDDSSSDDSSSDDNSSVDSSSDDSSSDDSSSDDSSSDNEDNDSDDDSDDEIEQIKVVGVTFNGKEYLKSLQDDLIYDRETEEHVGSWKDNKIVFK